jgi:hypothetical protein
MRNVIYMHFLALESARKAVRDLIEFKPTWAENTITILISELPAYRFLLNHFPKDDVRYSRLQLRESRYRSLVPEIYYQVGDDCAKHLRPDRTEKQLCYLGWEALQELRRDWAKADGMLNELKLRYESAFGEFPRREVVESSKLTQPAGYGQRSGFGTAQS